MRSGIGVIFAAYASACGAPRPVESPPPPTPDIPPVSGSAGDAAAVAVAVPDAAAPLSVPAVVAWDHLVAESRFAGAKLFPIHAIGALEARGVVAVGQGTLDAYVPSSRAPIASTTSDTLGFEVSPVTVAGTAADVVFVVAASRDQIVALDTRTLVERFTIAAPKGTRIHRMGEAAGIIWLDLVYPKGSTLLGMEPGGRQLWKVDGVIGALDSGGERIIGSELTAYDARSGTVAWQHPVDPERHNKTVGATFTVVETSDHSVVEVLATRDGSAVAKGKLGEVSPFDRWLIADDTLYAAIVDPGDPPTRTRIVAWDPRTAKPIWTALDRRSFYAEAGLHTALLPTRRDLFFLDEEDGTISAIDRVTHVVRWRRGFDGPSSMVFANDGAAALYVASSRGVEVFRPSPTSPTPERVTIRGVVTFDARPRAGAWVRASCGLETRSDARGRFSFTCDATGAVTVATLVKAVRARGCQPTDARDETIVLTGTHVYEVELPTTSSCGD